ncbi:hypothetical protein Pta02_80540 [Planobispora takensis]|uniref:Uncharacterized protein n=1 Tax=Planobispora takensis TaxID=1367882 RepID=A0A8J3T7V8_9ACTN|nr:hypothetical protein Pta02_80540 [Planobispora takensis]
MAARRDAGFDWEVFAEMLAYVRRRTDEEFGVYGVGAAESEALRERFGVWEKALRKGE